MTLKRVNPFLILASPSSFRIRALCGKGGRGKNISAQNSNTAVVIKQGEDTLENVRGVSSLEKDDDIGKEEEGEDEDGDGDKDPDESHPLLLVKEEEEALRGCLLYTSPSPRD